MNAMVLFAAAVGSCHRPDARRTSLVVGVQSEPLGGVFAAMHVVIRVAGAIVDDEVVTPPSGSRVGFPQPWEKRLFAPNEGDPTNAEVVVDVETLGAPGGPTLRRHASSHFVAGRTTLLRVALESRCIVYPPPGRHGHVPGPLSGPTCPAPTSCVRGLCQTGVVPVNKLEPYAPDWPTNAPDLCRPRDPGPPTVQIGTGQTGYLPLTAGETLQAEAGPQGGHHLWIAVRMKNLKQLGSTTRIEAVQPETGAVVPASTFAFTFERDEGGYCKLYGLRYQLDSGGVDYTRFLGKPLDVTTTVIDPVHGSASSTVRIQVAPTVLNP